MDEEITITMKAWEWLGVLVDLDALRDSELLEAGSDGLIFLLRDWGVTL